MKQLLVTAEINDLIILTLKFKSKVKISGQVTPDRAAERIHLHAAQKQLIGPAGLRCDFISCAVWVEARFTLFSEQYFTTYQTFF